MLDARRIFLSTHCMIMPTAKKPVKRTTKRVAKPKTTGKKTVAKRKAPKAPKAIARGGYEYLLPMANLQPYPQPYPPPSPKTPPSYLTDSRHPVATAQVQQARVQQAQVQRQGNSGVQQTRANSLANANAPQSNAFRQRMANVNTSPNMVPQPKREGWQPPMGHLARFTDAKTNGANTQTLARAYRERLAKVKQSPGMDPQTHHHPPIRNSPKGDGWTPPGGENPAFISGPTQTIKPKGSGWTPPKGNPPQIYGK